jgi:hypothetical protein
MSFKSITDQAAILATLKKLSPRERTAIVEFVEANTRRTPGRFCNYFLARVTNLNTGREFTAAGLVLDVSKPGIPGDRFRLLLGLPALEPLVQPRPLRHGSRPNAPQSSLTAEEATRLDRARSSGPKPLRKGT